MKEQDQARITAAFFSLENLLSEYPDEILKESEPRQGVTLRILKKYFEKEFYEMHLCSSPLKDASLPTFRRYLNKEIDQCVLRIYYDKKFRCWRHVEWDFKQPKEDDPKFMETGKQEETKLLEIFKTGMESAFEKVVNDVSEKQLSKLVRSQIQQIVQKEFKEEVIPAVMENLTSILQSTKEELELQISQQLNKDTIKECVSEVLVEAFSDQDNDQDYTELFEDEDM